MSAAEQAARVAIVIVNYRTPDLAVRCVRSLVSERGGLPDLQVVVVDGGSDDGSAEALADALAAPEFAEWVSVLALPINGGFGWANNQAMLRLLQSDRPPDFIHLLNPDTEIEPGAISLLAEYLVGHPRCGAVGSRLLDPDGTPSGSAFRFPSIGREFLRGAATPALGRLLSIAPTLAEDAGVTPDWVTGASVMFRAQALREAGLFDDGFFLYFEEVELMWRLRQHGWSVAHEPRSRVFHIGGAATGVRVTKAQRRPAYWYNSRRRMFVRTRGRVAGTAATFAWMAGRSLWTLRQWFGLARGRSADAPEIIDHFQISLRSHAEDGLSAAPKWTTPPGAHPAWMKVDP